MDELESQSNAEESSGAEFARRLSERRSQSLDLLAAQRKQFDEADTTLEAHLAELEQQLIAGLNDAQQQATCEGERAELDELAKRLHKQAEELTSGQAALAADRAEIASRHAELHLAREQLAKQHQERIEKEEQEREQLDRRAAELQATEAKLKQAHRDLTQAQEETRRESHQRQQELTDQQRDEAEQLERRAAELNALEAKLKQTEHALTVAQEEHHSGVRQFAGRREHLDEQHLRLEKELEEIESRREETRAQRRRIAQQLRIERTALIQERELMQAEVERQRALFQKEIERGRIQLNADRETFEQDINRARQQLRRDREQLEDDETVLEKARRLYEETRRQAEQNRSDQSADLLAASHEIEELTAQLIEAQRTAAQGAENLQHLQAEHDKLRERQRSQTELSAESDAANSSACQALTAERDMLTVRVEELEQELAAAEKSLAAAEQQLAATPLPADENQMEDLQRRFEMAVDDVRQLKRRNAELEKELADLQANAQAPQPARAESTYSGDWESTKRRLLAELQEDAEQPPGKKLTVDDRLSVEGTIRITDEMVAQRDQEIADLKEQLAQQGNQLAATEQTTVVSAAEAEVLDQDAVVQQERQRLVDLQKEWQDKLRQAEVDISVQRARLARERSEVEERLRVFEAEKTALAGQQPGGQSAADDASKKPGRRWLTRLGLKENDQE
jgi:chromosome segregation ATPase